MEGLEHTDHFCKFIGEGDIFEVTMSIKEKHVLKKKEEYFGLLSLKLIS